jgi:hypothetical protein
MNLRMIRGIDMTRTKCNDIYTTLKHYGIDGSKTIIII